MEREKLHVLMVRPGEEAYEADIEDSLEGLQEAVGGGIKVALILDDDECLIICNEEGKVLGLEENRALRYSNGYVYDVVVGPFIVAAEAGENFVSLNEEQVKRMRKLFGKPECFTRYSM